MRSIKTLITIAVVTWLWAPLAAQNFENPTKTNVVPRSPEAASLGKYGEYPVSHYTGIPNIGVPLYTVKSGDLSLPISLNYHAGGIKVDEIASWVGLGWSLNAGGVITRSVRGTRDEKSTLSHRNYRQNYDYFTDPDISQDDKDEFAIRALQGLEDLEPDIYYYNFAGRSGKFFLDYDTDNPGGDLVAYAVPQQGLKFEYVISTNGYKRWIITTEDGVKYVFGTSLDESWNAIELNDNYSVCTDPSGSNNSGETSLDETSWFLVQIISPKGDEIQLNYEDYTTSNKSFASETYYGLLPGTLDPRGFCRAYIGACYNRNRIQGKRLSSIIYNNGRIDFDPQQATDGTPIYRSDLCSAQALEQIRINDNEGNLIKGYEFSYDYFKRPADPTPPVFTTPCGDSDAQARYRLKLESLQAFGSNDKEVPPYRFTYNENRFLPPRLYWDGERHEPSAFGQDHWGYYNGVTNNTFEGIPSLIPTLYEDYQYINPENQINLSGIMWKKGADRTSDPESMKAFVLSTIQYPTGGSTSFEYGANQIASDQIPSNYNLSIQDRVVGSFNFTSDPGDDHVQDFDSFTIDSQSSVSGQPGALVKFFIFDRHNGTDNVENECDEGLAVDRYIMDTDGNVIRTNPSNGTEIFLPNGTYFVRVQRNPYFPCHSVIEISLRWDEISGLSSEVVDLPVGGLRIEKITNHDGIDPSNDIVTNYSYNSLTNPAVSSGQMVNFPRYGWKYYQKHYRYLVEHGALYDQFILCPYIIWQSFSQDPLASTSGGVIGYENVTVWQGSEEIMQHGRTEYTFRTPREFPDYYSNDPRYVPANSRDWLRGQLKETRVYNSAEAGDVLVAESTDRYRTVADHQALGIKLFLVHVHADAGDSPGGYMANSYHTSTGFVYSEYQTESSNFDSNGENPITTYTDYVYSADHFQLQEVRTSNSEPNGGYTMSRFTYPQDFEVSLPDNPSDDEGLALRRLIDENRISVPIERIDYRGTNDGYRVVGGVLNRFKIDPHSQTALPHNSYQLETIPVINDYDGANYVNGSGISMHENYSEEFAIERFDGYGNPTEVIDRSGVPKVMIWGYEGEYLIAKIENVTYEVVEAVLGSEFTLQGPDGFMLSHEQLRQLRGISGALVTSYTHDIGYGVRTITDPNGIETTYEYDEFGRLERIIDHDSNVLKQYEYNYKEISGQ